MPPERQAMCAAAHFPRVCSVTSVHWLRVSCLPPTPFPTPPRAPHCQHDDLSSQSAASLWHSYCKKKAKNSLIGREESTDRKVTSPACPLPLGPPFYPPLYPHPALTSPSPCPHPTLQPTLGLRSYPWPTPPSPHPEPYPEPTRSLPSAYPQPTLSLPSAYSQPTLRLPSA